MSVQPMQRQELEQVIALAGMAPSIHNSQPWDFDLSEDRIDLYADFDRWLPATDSDGRDLMLSCGAALHHLRVALAGQGIRTAVRRLPDEEQPELVATVRLGVGELTDPDLLGAIPRRHTDRRRFGDWPIPADFRDRFDRVAARYATLLRFIDNPSSGDLLAGMFREAAGVQSYYPGYAEELRQWTVDRPATEGVPAENVVLSRRVWAARDFGEGVEEIVGSNRDDGAALLLLGTVADDALLQLQSGEALSALLLQATDFGLSSCVLTQPLEVPAVRSKIGERILQQEFCPQALVRLGWPASDAPVPATPRRPVAETIGRPARPI